MAVISATRVYNPVVIQVTYTWASLAVGDTGAFIDVSDLVNKTMQVTSAGAGTAQIRATVDGANFVGLTAALGIGAAAPMAVGLGDMPVAFRAVDVSAVATAGVTVTLVGYMRRPLLG